ncbi:MAG: hypothetical protein HC915_00255, partial [Anaerolineae bacterium]|nr:hypothetical protein [Anaerolineae bacterium]
MLLGMLITRQPKRILLFFFVLAIPFNLRFTPFVDNLAYHSGGAPPAVLIYVYDFPLIGLLGLFLLEITLHRKPLRFGVVDLLAVLFILWNVVGIFRSVDVTLSLYESFRIFKLYLAGYIVML